MDGWRATCSQNMQTVPANAVPGAWAGLYFDAQVENDQAYRLYYDQAPADALDRLGNWFLLAELNWEE